MSPGLQRRRRRLSAETYRKLHKEVLERDSWRRQACGSLRGIEVHHIQCRSQSGDDSEGNLITLCSDCHTAIHAYWHEPTFRGTSTIPPARLTGSFSASNLDQLIGYDS